MRATQTSAPAGGALAAPSGPLLPVQKSVLAAMQGESTCAALGRAMGKMHLDHQLICPSSALLPAIGPLLGPRQAALLQAASAGERHALPALAKQIRGLLRSSQSRQDGQATALAVRLGRLLGGLYLDGQVQLDVHTLSTYMAQQIAG